MIIEYVHTKNSNSDRDVPQRGDRRKKKEKKKYVKVIRGKQRKRSAFLLMSCRALSHSRSLIHSNVACSTRKSIRFRRYSYVDRFTEIIETCRGRKMCFLLRNYASTHVFKCEYKFDYCVCQSSSRLYVYLGLSRCPV